MASEISGERIWQRKRIIRCFRHDRDILRTDRDTRNLRIFSTNVRTAILWSYDTMVSLLLITGEDTSAATAEGRSADYTALYTTEDD